MLIVGKAYYIKTLSHYYIGRVTSCTPTHATMSECSEIDETGPYSTFFGTGKPKISERVPDGAQVPLNGSTVHVWANFDGKEWSLPKTDVR
jgi:hypothetical protein